MRNIYTSRMYDSINSGSTDEQVRWVKTYLCDGVRQFRQTHNLHIISTDLIIKFGVPFNTRRQDMGIRRFLA